MTETGISLMNSSPKEQYLKFILDRGAALFSIVTDPTKDDPDCEVAFLALCSFISDPATRADAVKMYFEECKKYSKRSAVLLCTGPVVEAVASACDITESSAGAFI